MHQLRQTTSASGSTDEEEEYKQGVVGVGRSCSHTRIGIQKAYMQGHRLFINYRYRLSRHTTLSRVHMIIIIILRYMGSLI